MRCTLTVENTAVNKTNEVSALGGLREGSEGRRGGRPVDGRHSIQRVVCVVKEMRRVIRQGGGAVWIG